MKGQGCLCIVSQYVWDMDLESKFLKGLLDKLEDFAICDNLKGTESWWLLVGVKKLRSGVFKSVSDLFNFINEKQTKSLCQ